MTRVDDAGRLFMEGKSCSQAVFTAYAPSFGMTEAEALRLAAGFGGGMHAGSVCGAATGAVLALGLAYAGEDCASDRKTVMGAVEAFHARFRERVGATDCPDILGCDVRTAEGIAFNRANNLREQRCLGVVRTAAEILEELLDAEWQPQR